MDWIDVFLLVLLFVYLIAAMMEIHWLSFTIIGLILVIALYPDIKSLFL